MREQTELTFVIGFERPKNSLGDEFLFAQRVVEIASQLCGGCSVHQAVGFWKEDGAEHKEVFTGKTHKESSMILKLSCENHKVNFVYDTMKRHISGYAHSLGVDIDWVHVQKIPFVGMHFSVKDTVENMDRSVYRDIVSPGTRSAR